MDYLIILASLDTSKFHVIFLKSAWNYIKYILPLENKMQQFDQCVAVDNIVEYSKNNFLLLKIQEF
jgi:hypothetical protein